MVLYSIAKWYIGIGLCVAAVFWGIVEFVSYIARNEHVEVVDNYIDIRDKTPIPNMLIKTIKSVICWPILLCYMICSFVK